MSKTPKTNSVLIISIPALAPVSVILFYALAKMGWAAIDLTNLILAMSFVIICLIAFCILLWRR